MMLHFKLVLKKEKRKKNKTNDKELPSIKMRLVNTMKINREKEKAKYNIAPNLRAIL